MKRKPVSLDDIAVNLGVSKSLVSFVLNDKADLYGISLETRQRVFEKAKEMNYKPNHFARGLRLGKSFTIGLIVSDIANGFYSKIARQIEDLAEENGYNLIISSTDEIVEREVKLIRLLRNRQVDGLIISSSQSNPDEFYRLRKEGIPFVLIDRYFKGAEFPAVLVDNGGGAGWAADHFYEMGFRKPLVLAISPIHIYTIQERLKGFKVQFARKGINPVVEEIPFNNTQEHIDRLISKYKQSDKMPDCIFALNNNLATATLLALKRNNIRIPDQVGLICFDDVPFFSLVNPAITAIAQPVNDICAEAFDCLMKQIDPGKGGYINGPIYLPCQFIVRESTRIN